MSAEHYDIIIIGAGLSGICMAHYIKKNCPSKSFLILEARSRPGGTWDLFRYPGIRSDSDMSTLGYRFRPWQEHKQIADGASILNYIKETAEFDETYDAIRFNQRLDRMNWSTDQNSWNLHVYDKSVEQNLHYTTGFVVGCTGYYSYDGGFQPEFKGLDDFGGTFIHPQEWPGDLAYQGKKIVVIGSGATAVTLVPALAEGGASGVTMLQRSPTYLAVLPSKDPIAPVLNAVLPSKSAASLIRWKNFLLAFGSYKLSHRFPGLMKKFFLLRLRGWVKDKDAMKRNFTPYYNPWEQRVCVVPDGDLFKALNAGKCEVVTDEIERFVAEGIVLKSGKTLAADIIVSATGLNLLVFGGIKIAIDNQKKAIPDTFVYKSTMLSEIPNFAMITGYTNSSWTLKADLVSEYISRLINYMDANRFKKVSPDYRGDRSPSAFLAGLSSGYILRAMHQFPSQGDASPWTIDNNYIKDIKAFRRSPIDDGHLLFS